MSIKLAYCKTDFGIFELKGTKHGVSSIRLTKKKIMPHQQIVPTCLRDAVCQLNQYFLRKRKNFELKLDFGGAPPFHQAVWEELLTIPYGHTTSYSAIAYSLGDLNKVRAVGQANRNNPIAIVVPCHRVIAKNGDLQGYFYGVEMKRKLLELENPMSFGSQGLLF